MVKNRFWVRGYEAVQGMYHTPDLARIEPEIKRCMEAAAVSEVMISDV
jgi:hypothetical protein